MNRIGDSTYPPLGASNDQGPQLWLVRSGREQKAFVASVLQLVERLDTWPGKDPASTADAVAAAEREASAQGMHQLALALRAILRMLTVDLAREGVRTRILGTLEALPREATQRLSVLLLRVYLTGTDNGGEPDRESVEQVTALRMQRALPHAPYLNNGVSN